MPNYATQTRHDITRGQNTLTLLFNWSFEFGFRLKIASVYVDRDSFFFLSFTIFCPFILISFLFRSRFLSIDYFYIFRAWFMRVYDKMLSTYPWLLIIDVIESYWKSISHLTINGISVSVGVMISAYDFFLSLLLPFSTQFTKFKRFFFLFHFGFIYFIWFFLFSIFTFWFPDQQWK